MLKSVNIICAGLALALMSLLAGCGDNDDGANSKPIIRGLKTVVVENEEHTTQRKYPSVLQPASISTLSFEVAGRLGEINLKVGQIVKKGDVLARVSPTTLKLAAEGSAAALREAQSLARKTTADFKRKANLRNKGVVTAVVFDNARSAAESAAAKVVQAKKQLDTAKEDLGKAVLKAPFDGIINTVDADSFANVTSGTAIATLYSSKLFEAAFSVNYDMINQLIVGKKALIRLSDNPAIKLNAQISELGARADTVSSYPVVIRLSETSPELKAGMAIEVSFKFPVQNGKGFLLPLTVMALEGDMEPPKNQTDTGKGFVYIFDKATSTVKRREVMIGGVRKNSLIIISGLKQGEHVASAGVSFLRDGQTVKMLPQAPKE